MNHLHVALLCALLPFVFLAPACGDDHHHAHDTDALAAAACESAATSMMTVAAETTGAGTSQVIAVNAHPVTITLTAGASNYVTVETLSLHTDGAFFMRPAGVLKAIHNPEDNTTLVLESRGAPSACPADIGERYYAHIHMPQTYVLELDPAAGTEAWLYFLDEASDHAPTGHDDHE